MLGMLAALAAACASVARDSDASLDAPRVYYAVTAEIALARHEPRTAALQYTAAALLDSDASVLERASEVTLAELQPSLTEKVTTRWMSLYPNALEAHRARARAALELFEIERAASEYTTVLKSSPHGVDAELAELAGELETHEDVFGARQVADRLAQNFPTSAPALELAGLTELRADDPAAAVRTLSAALATTQAGAGNEPGPSQSTPPHETGSPRRARTEADARRALLQSLWRARVLNGEVAVPLNEARALTEREPSLANRLDYALLLISAQQTAAASEELEQLAQDTEAGPVAVRLLGLLDYEAGRLDAAAAHFTQLLTLGKSVDDAFYYLGLIAERRGEAERALRLFAQVQGGDDALSALLHAGGILREHGETAEAEELLTRLLEDDPQRAPQIITARAKMYAESGDPRAALALLDEGAEQYPDSVDLRYAIATTYESEGQVGAALRTLKAILAARPDDPAALNAYGYTLADHHRALKRARALIERAHSAAPKNAAILDSLGWVLYRQGDLQAALDPLRAAFAQDRGAEIGAHLGEVLFVLGRHEEAVKVWDEAGRAEPENKLLRQTRQRLRAS
jgi:tetratricopeptide (TPR) repeat protein